MSFMMRMMGIRILKTYNENFMRIDDKNVTRIAADKKSRLPQIFKIFKRLNENQHVAQSALISVKKNT